MQNDVILRDFCNACVSCDVAQVRKAIEAGVDVNQPLLFYPQYKYGAKTPIRWIFHCLFIFNTNDFTQRQSQCLQLLFEAGAYIDAIKTKGLPLLFIASENAEALRIFLDYDESIDTTHKGQPLLHFVCRQGYFHSLKLLLQRGADPNMKNVHGKVPLALCITPDVAEELLEYGADPRIPDLTGKYPLQEKFWAEQVLPDWTPFKMLPKWSCTGKAFSMYSDHCPGFRDAMMTLLLCLLRNRRQVCRDVCNTIIAHVAQAHKKEQWWPIVGFSIKKYI